MLLKLAGKQTLSSTFGANVSLTRMFDPKMITDLVAVDRHQTVSAQDLVQKVTLAVIRQKVSVKFQSVIQILKQKKCKIAVYIFKNQLRKEQKP